MDEMTENMKFVLDELNFRREDIETINYTYECCYGYATEDYEKTVVNRDNAKQVSEKTGKIEKNSKAGGIN